VQEASAIARRLALSGAMSWQLTGSDVISLAINVVQNGFDYRELRPDLAYFVGGSAPRPRGRGQSGEPPVPDAMRTMLEEVYRQILDANRRGAAQALTEPTDNPAPNGKDSPPGSGKPLTSPPWERLFVLSFPSSGGNGRRGQVWES